MQKFPFVLAFLAAALITSKARADEQPACPTPGEPCRILILTENEAQVLTQPNGILDTAAKARSLDLGALVTYFSTKIANAPAGKIMPKPEAKKEDQAPKTPEAGKK